MQDAFKTQRSYHPLWIIKQIMLSKEQIRKIFREKNFRIAKSMGQNFLVDRKVLNRIICSAELSRDDSVIEIGPGLGTLTEELAKRCARVIAIEKDKRIAELLRMRISCGDSCSTAVSTLEHRKNLRQQKRDGCFSQETSHNNGLRANRYFSDGSLYYACLKGEQERKIRNVKIIEGDILKMNLSEIIKKYGLDGKHGYKLISNIPYYITSPVIRLFLESNIQPKLIVLLVQKEVAERICAKKGKLNILALSVQLYGEPEIVGWVNKSSFYPEPKVRSAILRIRNMRQSFSAGYYKKLFRVIKIGFSSKRKKLVNNLSAGLGVNKEDISKVLLRLKINPDARAQELGIDDWKKLTELVG